LTWLVIDSCVYIDLWERGKNVSALTELGRNYIVRHSGVVLSELRRGARTRAAIELVAALRAGATDVWLPTEENWWSVGCLIQRVGDLRNWDARKRRDFQNDALIALTAKHHGASVLTQSQSDFEILETEIGLSVIYLD
jgi:predicted nucleic acid-binding protein